MTDENQRGSENQQVNPRGKVIEDRMKCVFMMIGWFVTLAMTRQIKAYPA